MGGPVVLSEQSLADLSEIVSYIARDNPELAVRFGNELIDRALSIGEFPEPGRQVPEFGVPAVREIVFSPYRIIYELLDEPRTVWIIRFWHGARGEPTIRRG